MSSKIGLSALAFVLAGAALAQTRPHPYDLIDVKWHVVLDDQNASLKGDIVNTVKPNKGVSEVWFDRGRLTIDAVMVDGQPAKNRIDGEKLYVTIPADKRDGREVAVRVQYDGSPEAGIYFVPASRCFPGHTPVIYTQGEMEDNRFWLVTYDYPDDKATSEGIIDVPKGYTTYSNGKLLSQEDEGDRTVWHWKMDKPHATYLISLVAGPYDTGHESWDDLPVQYGVPAGLQEMGETAFGGTADMIKFYSGITGFKYPYPKFSQEAVPDYMFGGMENITAVTQTIGALHPKSVDDIESSKGLVLHELAHQWFGDTVTCNGWSDAWINEGWATFMPAFYVRQTEGQEAFDLQRYGTFQGGLAAHDQDPGRPVVWRGYKDALDMFNGYIYPGGASRMFMLMNLLGEKQFWAACDKYLEERKYTSLNTEMFFDTWSRASGKDLTGFMKQWFFTPAAPNVTVKWSGDNVILSQPQPYFDLDLPVWVLNNGAWVKKSVHLTGADAKISFPGMHGKPVQADPEVWVMAHFHYPDELSTAAEIALYKAMPNAAGKQRVIDTFMTQMGPEDSLKFAKSMESKRILRGFVSHLSSTPGAREYLLQLTQDSDRQVAQAAAGQLRIYGTDPDVRARLLDLLDHDPNVLIQQTAARTLLEATNDPKLVDRLWNMDSFNDGFRSISLGWWVEHTPDAARTKCLDILKNPPSEPIRVQAIAALGGLPNKKGDTAVYDALKKIVVGEKSFGARSAAMISLARQGNKAALPLLRSFLDSPLVFFRQTSAAAVNMLGS